MVRSTLRFGEHEDAGNQVDQGNTGKEKANLLTPPRILIRQHEGNRIILSRG